jgi:hypothetical protein
MGEAIGLRVTVRNDTIAITLPGTWFAVTYRVAAVMLFFKGKDIGPSSIKGSRTSYLEVRPCQGQGLRLWRSRPLKIKSEDHRANSTSLAISLKILLTTTKRTSTNRSRR